MEGDDVSDGNFKEFNSKRLDRNYDQRDEFVLGVYDRFDKWLTEKFSNVQCTSLGPSEIRIPNHEAPC
jgi:hypothetical protein